MALARQKNLNAKLLAGFVDYLDRVAAQSSIDRHETLRAAAAGALSGSRLQESAARLGQQLAALAARRTESLGGSPASQNPGASCVIRLRADDPHLVTDRDGRVLVWPNRACLPADARPPGQRRMVPSQDTATHQWPRA